MMCSMWMISLLDFSQSVHSKQIPKYISHSVVCKSVIHSTNRDDFWGNMWNELRVVYFSRQDKKRNIMDVLILNDYYLIKTEQPASARAAPKFIVVVVLPTPPFWLVTAMIFGPSGRSGSDTFNVLYFQDSCVLVCFTRQSFI